MTAIAPSAVNRAARDVVPPIAVAPSRGEIGNEEFLERKAQLTG